MTRAVLVNGVPATGKSSIARAVGARLELPVLSLDSIKEALFDELGDADGDREFGRALGRASMQAIWSVVAGFPPTAAVVIEAWFRLPPHDAVVEGLRRAGIERWAEIWCHASVDVLVARYAARTRHPGHPPARRSLPSWRNRWQPSDAFPSTPRTSQRWIWTGSRGGLASSWV